MVDINLLLDRAGLLLDQGRYKDAEEQIKKALAVEPENDEALALLGRCLLNARHYDEGIDIIGRAISIDPENDFYFYLLGFGYYHKDQLFAARENFQKAITLNPYHAEYYGMLAHVLLEEKEFEQALEKSNEGLAVDAENITCLNARSIALNKLKRTEDAIATMQNALAQDPDNEITHTTVGWNLLEKGAHKEATQHFLEALRIRPDYYNAKAGLKESLKSKVPVYKWMLQYSFWINNQGKTLQKAMPFIIYAVFRVLISVLNANNNTNIALAVGGIYILFVVTSWTINSIANFFLLYHPIGKHALTNSEKWSALMAVPFLLAGIATLILASFTSIAEGTAYDQLFIAGMVAISLALPLSLLEYPLRFNNRTWKQWYTLILAATGVFSLLLFAVAPAVAVSLMIGYGVAFVIYTWIGS